MRSLFPCVKRHQQKPGKVGKVILMTDNAPSHPNRVSVIETEEGIFKIIFLPPM